MSILLQTEHLTLRPFQVEDAPALTAICNEDYVLKWMPDWKSSVENNENLIRFFLSQYPPANKITARIMLAVVLDGAIIGMVGIGNKEEVDNEIEIAYFISEDCAGNGYITEAAKALSRWSLDALGMDYLIAIAATENIPSQRVLEKCGFEKIETRAVLNSGERTEKPFHYYRLYRDKSAAHKKGEIMKEIEANKEAWNLLSESHYHTFLKAFQDGSYHLKKVIVDELGDIRGKKLLHLQCNTGADSICLARLGADVTGVDLSPENVRYAQKLAADLGVENVRFIQSDIMELMDVHHEKYDVVFTSEGAIGWLPDLGLWGKTIRSMLKDDGFFYVNDSHPFFLAMDEEKIVRGELAVKYPYFSTVPDVDDIIGGYAGEAKTHENYFWMYTVSKVINSLAAAGLHIEFFNEFAGNIENFGNMEAAENGLYEFPFNHDRFPMTFSLKANVYK